MNIQAKELRERAHRAGHCLKGLAHEARLVIVMTLRSGEKGVNELSELTGYPQPTVSQHLSKMKERDLVAARREGNQIFYSIKDKRLLEFLDLMKVLFCK